MPFWYLWSYVVFCLLVLVNILNSTRSCTPYLNPAFSTSSTKLGSSILWTSSLVQRMSWTSYFDRFYWLLMRVYKIMIKWWKMVEIFPVNQILWIKHKKFLMLPFSSKKTIGDVKITSWKVEYFSKSVAT